MMLPDHKQEKNDTHRFLYKNAKMQIINNNIFLFLRSTALTEIAWCDPYNP